MTVYGTAPAKVILCGEHAVVHGYPAIAIPLLQLRTTATLRQSEGPFQITSQATGEHLTATDADHPFIELSNRICAHLFAKLPSVAIHITSDIPPASGLGSGAAAAAAIARALYHHADLAPNAEQINSYVYETEKRFHGAPSGIDNTVIVHEKPIFFVKNQPISFFAPVTPFRFVVANSGAKASTRETVAAVQARYDAERAATTHIFERIRQITEAARQTIEVGDMVALGSLLTENHHLLQQLTVSSIRLDALVTASLQAGALGAKLSGAGRGGNMIALVTDETQAAVEDALTAAGGSGIFSSTLR